VPGHSVIHKEIISKSGSFISIWFVYASWTMCVLAKMLSFSTS
jgi:hypothetical protein